MNIINNNNQQMVNYKYGKIYKIQCNKTKDIYVGSTCCRLLCQRLRQHVYNYKCYLNGKTKYMTAFKILKNDDYQIELIQKFPCGSKDELHKRERYYIETFECVNKNVPGRTRKECQKKYREEHKEELKKYREEHKEELKEYQKEYREENKEQLCLKKKEYGKKNKEYIKEYKKKLNKYQSSWGGDKRSNNNLLCIDVDLFT